MALAHDSCLRRCGTARVVPNCLFGHAGGRASQKSTVLVQFEVTTIRTVLHCAYATCRFIVRDFEYNPKAIASEAEERGKLELQMKKQFVGY